MASVSSLPPANLSRKVRRVASVGITRRGYIERTDLDIVIRTLQRSANAFKV